MKALKVYYPFNRHISRAMWRIRDALIRYAPDNVIFVNHFSKADLHILDFIGQHPEVEEAVLHPRTIGRLFKEAPSLPRCDKYVILLHTPPLPEYRVQKAELQEII